METVVAYDFVFSTYWGQGRAMLKGLNTTVRLPNGNLEEIQWGIKFQEEHKDVYRLVHFFSSTSNSVIAYNDE